MKKAKKLLALLLALLTLASCAVGCGSKDEDAETTEASTTVATEAETEYVLPTIDLEGKEVTLLAPLAKAWHFEESGSYGNQVDASIIERNILVAETLNCQLVIDSERANSEFKAILDEEVLSGGGTYDIVYTDYWYDLETHGYFANLKDEKFADIIELDREWYCQGWNNSAEIRGTLTGLVGYGSIQMMSDAAVVYYNKSMYEELYPGKNIYDTVWAGDWTLEEMLIAAEAAKEVSGDGVWDDTDDVYGITYEVGGGRAMFYAFGGRFFERDGNGDPVYTPRTTQNISAFETIFDLTQKTEYVLYDNGAIASTVNYKDIAERFDDGRALFMMHTYSNSPYLNGKVKYGFLPYPKIDDTQEDYISSLTGCSYWGIPTNASSSENSAILLNAMQYYSYTLIKPAFYDNCLKLKLADDPDSSKVVDLTLSNIDMDFAFIYSGRIDGVGKAYFDNLIAQNKNTYASYYSQEKDATTNIALNNLLALYVDAYATVE